MADITVTKDNQCSLGNKTGVTASSASIATAATWKTGLGSVDQVFVTGFTKDQDYSWSASGGVVTFTVTAGPLLNVDLLAIGSP